MRTYLALAFFYICSAAAGFPTEGTYHIQDKLGCKLGKWYCDAYVTHGDGEPAYQTLLLRDKSITAYRKNWQCWGLEKKTGTEDTFAIRKCHDWNIRNPNYKPQYWTPKDSQWVELTPEKFYWKFRPGDTADSYILSSDKNCDQSGKGDWPCGSDLYFSTRSGLGGHQFLRMENGHSWKTNFKFTKNDIHEFTGKEFGRSF